MLSDYYIGLKKRFVEKKFKKMAGKENLLRL